jgi:hypothetical protein
MNVINQVKVEHDKNELDPKTISNKHNKQSTKFSIQLYIDAFLSFFLSLFVFLVTILLFSPIGNAVSGAACPPAVRKNSTSRKCKIR